MKPYFIVRLLLTIGYKEKFFAYEVKRCNLIFDLIEYYVSESPNPISTVTRILSNYKLPIYHVNVRIIK